MAAQHTNLLIEQGSSFRVLWPILDQDGEQANLTGYTVKAQVRESVGSPNVLYEWSTQEANAGVDGTGVFLIVTPAESTAWTWTRGVYDVEITAPVDQDSTVYRIAQGYVTVSPEVTR